MTPVELAAVHVEIGKMMIGLPQAADFARHMRPMNTMIDYVLAPDTDSKAKRIAKWYLKDFFQRPFGMTTDDLLERWFYDAPEPQDE